MTAAIGGEVQQNPRPAGANGLPTGTSVPASRRGGSGHTISLRRVIGDGAR